MPPNTVIQIRRGTSAEWSSINPVLAAGELGLDTDADQIKIGDGATTWNSLPFYSGGLTIEQIQDELGNNTLVAGTNIGINYDDEAGTITFNVPTMAGGASLEEVQDNLGTTFLVAGTNITLDYDDEAGTLTVNSAGGTGSSNPLRQVGNQVKLVYMVTADSTVPSDGWYFPDESVPDLTGRTASITWEGTSTQIPDQGSGDADFRLGDTALIRTGDSSGGGGTFPESTNYMSHGMLTSKEELDAQPMSGTLWDQLLTEANRDDHQVDEFEDHNAPYNTQTFAKALVYVRMKGNVADSTADPYRAQVAQRIQDFVNLTLTTGSAGGNSTSLSWARNTAALVVAADFINLEAYNSTLASAFRDKLEEVRLATSASSTDGFDNMPDGSKRRPNNIGMSCRLSLACIYLYNDENMDRMNADVIAPMRRWLGNTTFHNGSTSGVNKFSWHGNTDGWQINSADSTTWVGVNPAGATKDGHDWDGLQPEDYRRGIPNEYTSPGDFPNDQSSVHYVYDVIEILGWLIPMLERAGFPAKTWSDEAFRRSVEHILRLEDTAPAGTGHDRIATGFRGNGAVVVVNAMYDTAHPEIDPASYTRAYSGEVGWSDFMFKGRSI